VARSTGNLTNTLDYLNDDKPLRDTKGLDDDELTSLVDDAISDAMDYDGSELSAQREKALLYYGGDTDIPLEEGKSKVVSHDVSDALNWIMPSLLRVFLSGPRVALFTPRKPGDEQFTSDATDYINHKFLNECDGYRVLHHALWDGLLHGNGIVKHWWETVEEIQVREFEDLSDDEFVMLSQHDEIEVLEHTETVVPPPPEVAAMVQTVNPMAPLDALGETKHSAKLKRTHQVSRLRIMPVPPEDFLIERGAVALDEDFCRFVAHRDAPTRSELIRRGYDRDKVDDLPAVSESKDDDLSLMRNRLRTMTGGADSHDKSVERVEIFECYIQVDYDGDGRAEWRQVVIGGLRGNRSILAHAEWDDDLPFSDLVPSPMPHRWQGRSIFDELQDIQDIKTVLQRQTLDNLYLTNNPRQEVVENQVLNKDAVINWGIGETVWTKSPNAIRTIDTPFVAQNSFGMLEYLDRVFERRTGVSQTSMGLDLDALQNQTATAVNAMQSAAYTKVETYSRNLAEMGGMKRMFRSVLRLLVKHQKEPGQMRSPGLEGPEQWTTVDPSQWPSDMDVEINVGLGAGSRDRDLAMLQAVLVEQKAIIQFAGINNPIVSLDKYRNTLAKLIEVAGMKRPEQYFNEITPEQMQELASKPPPPDPKAIEAQAKLQMDQIKFSADIKMKGIEAQLEKEAEQLRMAHQTELERIKMQFQASIKAADAEAASRMEMERLGRQSATEQAQAQADIAVKRDEAAMAMAMEERRFERETAMERERFEFEKQLKLMEFDLKSAQAAQAAQVAEARPE